MKDNNVYLKHILDEINYLQQETKDATFELFIKDGTLTRACARSLEIIGEAVKNISTDFKNKHKTIEWKKLSGLRDKVIHYYFGVDWDIVWDVIKNKIPEIKMNLEKIINK